ncbi:hypothetical protein C3920_13610, partial [Novacetimonas pomaceti]
AQLLHVGQHVWLDAAPRDMGDKYCGLVAGNEVEFFYYEVTDLVLGRMVCVRGEDASLGASMFHIMDERMYASLGYIRVCSAIGFRVKSLGKQIEQLARGFGMIGFFLKGLDETLYGGIGLVHTVGQQPEVKRGITIRAGKQAGLAIGIEPALKGAGFFQGMAKLNPDGAPLRYEFQYLLVVSGGAWPVVPVAVCICDRCKSLCAFTWEWQRR